MTRDAGDVADIPDVAGDKDPVGDLLTLVPFFGDTVVFCFDARGIEEIATSPGRFPKNLSMYSTSTYLSLFCSALRCFYRVWFMLVFMHLVYAMVYSVCAGLMPFEYSPETVQFSIPSLFQLSPSLSAFLVFPYISLRGLISQRSSIYTAVISSRQKAKNGDFIGK